jgi:hypothetical protein
MRTKRTGLQRIVAIASIIVILVGMLSASFASAQDQQVPCPPGYESGYTCTKLHSGNTIIVPEATETPSGPEGAAVTHGDVLKAGELGVWEAVNNDAKIIAIFFGYPEQDFVAGPNANAWHLYSSVQNARAGACNLAEVRTRDTRFGGYHMIVNGKAYESEAQCLQLPPVGNDEDAQATPAPATTVPTATSEAIATVTPSPDIDPTSTPLAEATTQATTPNPTSIPTQTPTAIAETSTAQPSEVFVEGDQAYAIFTGDVLGDGACHLIVDADENRTLTGVGIHVKRVVIVADANQLTGKVEQMRAAAASDRNNPTGACPNA